MPIRIRGHVETHDAGTDDVQQQGAGNDMAGLADQIEQVGIAFSELERQLSALAARIRTMVPQEAPATQPVEADAAPVQPSDRADHGESVVGDGIPAIAEAEQTGANFFAPSMPAVQAAAYSIEVASPDLAETVPPPPPPTDSAPTPSQRDLLDDQLQAYRDLIAQPQKRDINRWIDEQGGLTCEVGDDNGFQLPAGDSKGLLALIPFDGTRAIVVPAGRLVVEFATSFANVIAMRSVTRQAFELNGSGSGRLQLIEPAYATNVEGDWKLERPGRLGGFSAD